ncbi:hypothetical protein E6R61_18720 [Streptomyces sp. LRa12]|nr:hypothetical protein E6R61_18720 [Streptomyces sp. LRa12]
MWHQVGRSSGAAGVGGDGVDDGARRRVGDLISQAEREGDPEQAARSTVSSGSGGGGVRVIGSHRGRRCCRGRS